MALSIKSLGDGQLPAAKATLYTVPAVTQAIVALISLTNTGAAARTVNIYLNLTGTSRRISGENESIDVDGRLVLRGPFTLEAGDLIEGDASAATEVDYTIHGVENA